jgi:hypothetical protein
LQEDVDAAISVSHPRLADVLDPVLESGLVCLAKACPALAVFPASRYDWAKSNQERRFSGLCCGDRLRTGREQLRIVQRASNLSRSKKFRALSGSPFGVRYCPSSESTTLTVRCASTICSPHRATDGFDVWYPLGGVNPMECALNEGIIAPIGPT